VRDYCEVLGVTRDASSEEIKKAYRRLAHRYHPDKNPGDAKGEERFKEASRAYEVLGDAQRRKKYDRVGRSGFESASSEWPGGFTRNMSDLFSDIFADLFAGRRERARERGRDRTQTLSIDFRTAVFGGEQTLSVVRNTRCDNCSGTGAQPGSLPQICHACGGSGDIRVQQGLLSVSKRCTFCRGRGKVITRPCADCGGTGVHSRPAQLKVRIPPGASDDTVLRFAGEGEPGANSGTPGDLRVLLRVQPHPIFRRQGDDVACEVPITLADAVLGGQVEVPTLDGRVRMKVPAGTQTGRVFRLRGKGTPRASAAGRGDQHVTVTVELPVEIDEHERALVEQLRKLDDRRHYPRRAEFWDLVGGDGDS